MGIRDIVSKFNSRNEAKSMMLKDALLQARVGKIVEDRQKSSNERELEGFIHREREAQIKEALREFRKREDYDIRFNHNPLDIPNITSDTEWHVLREPNMFSSSRSRASILNQPNIFVGVPNVVNPSFNPQRKSHPNLAKRYMRGGKRVYVKRK